MASVLRKFGRAALLVMATLASLPLQLHAADDEPEEQAEEIDSCSTARKDPWLAQFNDRIRAHDLLYQSIVERNGQPVSCDGRITQKTGINNNFGEFIFTWKDGSKFSARSLPPQTSVITVTYPPGGSKEDPFPSVKEYVTSRGFRVDWSKAKTLRSSTGSTEEFATYDAKMNTFVRFQYDKHDRLTSVEIDSAL